MKLIWCKNCQSEKPALGSTYRRAKDGGDHDICKDCLDKEIPPDIETVITVLNACATDYDNRDWSMYDECEHCHGIEYLTDSNGKMICAECLEVLETAFQVRAIGVPRRKRTPIPLSEREDFIKQICEAKE